MPSNETHDIKEIPIFERNSKIEATFLEKVYLNHAYVSGNLKPCEQRREE